MDSCGSLGVCLFECGEAFAQTGCVFVSDREDADAALGAAGMADEVRASALVGVGYCCVYDLDQGVDLRASVGDDFIRIISGNDALLTETRKEVEEAVVGGLVVEEAQLAAFTHVRDDLNGAAKIGVGVPRRD